MCRKMRGQCKETPVFRVLRHGRVHVRHDPGRTARSGPRRGGEVRPHGGRCGGALLQAGAPEVLSTGSGLTVSGDVISYPDCRPLPGARIEWWHADHSGRYVDSLRGMQKTGAKGSYAFTTSPPGVYPGRPLHIHFKVSVPGHKPRFARPVEPKNRDSIAGMRRKPRRLQVTRTQRVCRPVQDR